MLVMYIKDFLCVLTFVAYLCEFLLSFFFYSGSKWSNILYQYDGNFELKICLIFVPMKGKKSATITKHIKDFLKNKKIEINFCKMIST